jgi:hypothetical protein
VTRPFHYAIRWRVIKRPCLIPWLIMANSNQLGTKQFLYPDDLHVGQRFISDTHLIDEDEIKAFAKQFDPRVMKKAQAGFLS